MLRKKSSQIPSTKVGIPRYSAGTVLMVKPLVGALRPCGPAPALPVSWLVSWLKDCDLAQFLSASSALLFGSVWYINMAIEKHHVWWENH